MKKTRKEAIQAGEQWYFTDKYCKNGHLSKRYTLNGICEECRILAVNANRITYMEARSKNKE